MIENVRCFGGRHIARLAPLTLLVGENSSGKTTFLAMARLAWDALSRWDSIDFNDEPFRLGAFNDIISTSIESTPHEGFSIGYRFPPKTADNRSMSPTLRSDVEVGISFGRKDAQPTITGWKIQCDGYQVAHKAAVGAGNEEPTLKVSGPLTDLSITARDLPMAPSVFAICRNWHFIRRQLTSESAGIFGAQIGKPVAKEELETLGWMVSSVEVALRRGRPYASAPIRTRPTRTYDPLTDKPTPEGDHVPMMLAKLFATQPDKPQLRSLLDALHEFGGVSGLFKELDVKRMGGQDASLPFQIRVGMDNGPLFNLVDVGYGVSQVLPVLVDAIVNKDTMLLLQQPEVHLHPRAQAELGTFFGGLAKAHRAAPVVIETHSDYLLDRIRMDIRDRNGVTSGDVAILYFSRTSGGVSISEINIDDDGNLINPPKGYRDFFLAEDRRFLRGE